MLLEPATACNGSVIDQWWSRFLAGRCLSVHWDHRRLPSIWGEFSWSLLPSSSLRVLKRISIEKVTNLGELLCELFSLLVLPLRRSQFMCLECSCLECLHFYNAASFSDLQHIYRVCDHGFHDFLSPFKHDLVLYLNFWLQHVVLISGVNDST
jgi:hypothetical protein